MIGFRVSGLEFRGVSEIRAAFLGSFFLRESYYWGIYAGGLVNPHIMKGVFRVWGLPRTPDPKP